MNLFLDTDMDTDINIIVLGMERYAKKIRWFRSRGLRETYEFITGHSNFNEVKLK